MKDWYCWPDECFFSLDEYAQIHDMMKESLFIKEEEDTYIDLRENPHRNTNHSARFWALLMVDPASFPKPEKLAHRVEFLPA